MSTKWSSETLGKNGGRSDFSSLLKDESRIMLLRGKNVFDDFVYCYLKIAYPDIARLDAAISGEESFNIRDFGTVLAAGKGEPPDEVKAEIAASYPTLGAQQEDTEDNATKPKSAPIEKKAWDE